MVPVLTFQVRKHRNGFPAPGSWGSGMEPDRGKWGCPTEGRRPPRPLWFVLLGLALIAVSVFLGNALGGVVGLLIIFAGYMVAALTSEWWRLRHRRNAKTQ